MKRILIIAALVAISSTVLASHFHYWTKMSETTVTNRWGSKVQQCMWECNDTMSGTRHTTVTQGAGWCPRP